MSDPVPVGSFASAMSAGMERTHTTLSALRNRLAAKGHPISLTALSYWRSGQRLPERQSSLDAIPAIETILQLAPGTLARLVVGPTARRLGQVQRYDSLIPYPAIDPVAGEDFVRDGDVTRLATHIIVNVGRGHETLWARTRRVVVANRDGVEGFSVFTSSDEEQGVSDYQFRAIAGCTIEEDHQPAANVRKVELRFPRPLAFGESTITEVEVTQAAGAAPDIVRGYAVVASQRLEEALVWVQFDPSELPSGCWAYFDEDGVTHEWPINVEGTASAHYRQRDFGPGVLGIRWVWEDNETGAVS